MRDTAHLSMLEDCAYRRLMDVYYAREKPLPADEKAVCRLVRAYSKKERQAVFTVLREFFELCEDDCWHQRRCDAVLSRANEDAEESQTSHDGKYERQQRYRQRRKEMFEELRQYGVTPAFDTKTSELEALLLRHRDAAVTSPETQPLRNGDAVVTSLETAIHKPIANNQNPKPEETTNKPPPETREAVTSSSTSLPEENVVTAGRDAAVTSLVTSPETQPLPGAIPAVPDASPSRGAQIAVLLKRNGADPASHPASKGIVEMVELNLTDTEILLALQTAKQNRQASGSAQAVTAAYLLGIAKGQRQDRQKTARSPPDRRSRYAEQSRRISEMAAQADAVILAQMRPQPAVIDMGVIDASPAM